MDLIESIEMLLFIILREHVNFSTLLKIYALIRHLRSQRRDEIIYPLIYIVIIYLLKKNEIVKDVLVFFLILRYLRDI